MKIDANKGGVYEHKTGSRIVIPQSAFVDDKGALIEGDVDIRYREFHDYVDFFLSGIPMTYDSAGVTYTLESAGMMEVYAEQAGKRVRMAPGKDLNVELVSYINVPDVNVPPAYNIYKLDEEAKNWVFTDVDKIQIMEDDLVNLDPNDPTTPAKQDLRKELKRIKKLKESELARIENTIPPPAQGTDYDNALAIFNSKMSEYEALKAERDAKLAAEKAALEARMAAERLAANAKFDEALATLQAAGNTHGSSDLIMRKKIVNRFRATSFGVWNCDRPLPPDIQLLSAKFKTDKGQKLDNMTAYIVDKSLNTVNRFLATDEAYMSFNRNSQHILWVVTEDNKIAVFRNEDFKQIPEGEKDFTFVLKETGKAIENEADVREVLSL